MNNFKKKLPVVILAVLLAVALVLALVANNGKNAAIDANTQLSSLLETAATELTTAQTDLEAANTAKTEVETKLAEAETAAAAAAEEAAAKLAETETAAAAAAEEAAAKLAETETAAAAAAEEAAAKLAEVETAAAAAAEEAAAKLAEVEAAAAAAAEEAAAKLAETEAAAAAKLAEVETAAAAAAEEAAAKLAETEAAAAAAAEEAAAKLTETEAAAAAAIAELEAKLAVKAEAEALVTSDLTGKLVILHTNDVHGRASASEDAFGYARIATLKKNLEAQGAEVLLMDAGDFSQGTPTVNASYGKTATAFLNATGYDVVTLGNHEFDWGYENMLQNMEDAEFAVVCANLFRTADNTLVFPGNITFDTVVGKVGVFGLDTPETMTKTHPDKVKGITFAMTEELYKIAQAQVDELKAAGCDLIVCLGHLGDADESITNRSIDVLENVTGIDLFIDAHSHTTIDGGVMNGEALRTSTGCYSAAIGYVVVEPVTKDDVTTMNLTAGLYTVEDDAETALALGAGLAIDEEVAEIVRVVEAEVDAAWSAAFATTEVLLNGERSPGVRTEETNLGDFAADAILWAARSALGEDKVDAALTNGGGIRATIEIGEVTMKDMKTVFPYGNEVTTIQLTGAELLEALEAATWSTPDAIGAFPQVAGIEFTIDTTVPYVNGEQYPSSTYFAPANPGARVTIATVNGQPWAADAVYTIATNDFTAAGGDTYYAFAYPYTQTGYKTGVALEDALVTYTQTVLNGVIGEQYAEPAGRITIIK